MMNKFDILHKIQQNISPKLGKAITTAAIMSALIGCNPNSPYKPSTENPQNTTRITTSQGSQVCWVDDGTRFYLREPDGTTLLGGGEAVRSFEDWGGGVQLIHRSSSMGLYDINTNKMIIDRNDGGSIERLQGSDLVVCRSGSGDLNQCEIVKIDSGDKLLTNSIPEVINGQGDFIVKIGLNYAIYSKDLTQKKSLNTDNYKIELGKIVYEQIDNSNGAVVNKMLDPDSLDEIPHNLSTSQDRTDLGSGYYAIELKSGLYDIIDSLGTTQISNCYKPTQTSIIRTVKDMGTLNSRGNDQYRLYLIEPTTGMITTKIIDSIGKRDHYKKYL